MNRIFHARIAMGQYLFLILIGSRRLHALVQASVLGCYFRALAGGYYRESDLYHYTNARREVGAVLRPFPGVEFDERHHLRSVLPGRRFAVMRHARETWREG